MISVIAEDNIGVVRTVFLIDGKETELDENGTYTIKNAELKEYEINAKAYDEENNEGSASANIIVNEIKAPEISITFDKDMYIEGDSLHGLVTALGQREIITLTAELNGKPLVLEEGMFFIDELSAGDYTFKFTAEDAKEISSVIEKKITVLAQENTDKRLYANIENLVKYGETAVYSVVTSNEIDKNTISVKLNGNEIQLTDNLTYEFKGEKLFDNEFILTAKTVSGEEITVKTVVKVYETDKPIVKVTFNQPDGYYEHDDFIAAIQVEDVSGIKRVQFLYDGIEYPVDEDGTVTIKDFVVKPHVVIVRAWDEFDNCGMRVETFIVVDAGTSGGKGSSSGEDIDSKQLFSAIYSPSDEQVITSPAFIVGTAGGTDFEKYRLDYVSASGGEYTLLKEGTDSVKENILGEIDTTMIRNGLYKIRLTVWGKNGTTVSDEILVSIEGQMKIGNFSLDFQDMDINVAGLPVTLIRGYDSRDRNVSGDFGYGWNISTCSATITKSCNLSKGWEEQRSGYNYIYSPLSPHIVSVNWGNGKVEKFAMKLKSEGLASFRTVTVSYESIDGSGSTLTSVTNMNNWYYDSGEIYKLNSNYDEIAYNPEEWILKKADGTEYRLSQTRGVIYVKDANGNKVTFYTNGIADSDDNCILYNKDSNGRITSITSQTGKTVSYIYDDNGDLVEVTDVSGEKTKFEYENHYQQLKKMRVAQEEKE